MTAARAPAAVHLRPLGADDEAFYVAIYTDPALLAQVGPPLDDAAARRSFAAALREAARETPRRRLWVIAEGDPGVDVGLIGLLGDAREVEMGAVVRAACQGRGLARAAVSRWPGSRSPNSGWRGCTRAAPTRTPRRSPRSASPGSCASPTTMPRCAGNGRRRIAATRKGDDRRLRSSGAFGYGVAAGAMTGAGRDPWRIKAAWPVSAWA